MCEVLTVGETMVALSPKKVGKLAYASGLTMAAAGAESNTAIGLQKFGHSVKFISRFGADGFGDFLLRMLNAEGINTRHILTDQWHPTGLMVKERKRGDTAVYYYRKNSAASCMNIADIPDSCIADVKLVHITGITPVLSDSCEGMICSLIEKAQFYQKQISFDPNIRRKLWGEKDYVPLLRKFIEQSAYVLLGREEAEQLYVTSKKEKLRKYLLENTRTVVVALKDGGAGTTVLSKNSEVFIPPYPCNPIETVGAGDAFNAGFLSGILEGKTLEICGQMGAVAGACATECNGDYEGVPDREELEKMLSGEKMIYR